MSRIPREAKRAIAKGGEAAAKAAIRKGAPLAAAAAKSAARKTAPKVAARAARVAQKTGLLGMLGHAAVSPFRAILQVLLARLSELSSGAAISGGLANYAMIVSAGGSQTVALASLALSSVPALIPDGTFTINRCRRG